MLKKEFGFGRTRKKNEKRCAFHQRRRRRRQTIVKVNNKGGGVVNTPTIPSDTKTKTVFIGNSSEKTLLDLQSLNNKHN